MHASVEGELRVLIASDVSSRSGIGIELYLGKEIILEIFWDDANRTREVHFYRDRVALELVEKAIACFKEEIPWKFESLNDGSSKAEA